jgi:carboxypeptidase C (cathepsin A)
MQRVYKSMSWEIGGRLLAGVIALALLLAPAAAEEKQKSSASGPGVLRLLPANAVSEHTLSISGKTLTYQATAGTFSLYGQDGERTAAVFYTAYVLKGAPAATRPLTFAFNGGPGAASTYLNLGLAGPKILDFGPDGTDAANARLRDNPHSFLEFTDLVMIDPIGSGWSRTAKPDDAKNFYSVRADAQALAKVIALYTANNSRGVSPKYLLGESYGGFRAVKVAEAMQRDQGLVAAGLVLVSPFLEGALLFGGTRFALGAALHLPSLVAAELERRKAFSWDALAEAERFAMTDYLTTLAGAPPQGEAARSFYAKVAQMTGLPLDVVIKSRGFVRDRYIKNLRAAEGKVVSAYDASFAVPDPYPESDSGRGHADPVLDGFSRALGGAFVAFAREQLGFKTEMTYTLLASDVSRRWDWQGEGGRALASVSGDLRELLSVNPGMRVLIVHGVSDMVTPYGASRYMVNHLPPMGERVQLKLYRGGHMFYFAPEPRAAFSADAKAFYRAPE